jgi:hypothetical protein
MKKVIIVLAVSASILTGFAAGRPLEANRISADANWVVWIDFQQFLKSGLGQTMQTELAKKGVEEQLKNFALLFGFNPLTDVRNIMLYGQGNDPNKAVVIIDGKFDKAKILAFLGMNPEHKQFDYGTITIQQWRQGDENASDEFKYGCFYQDDLIIISSGLPALENAIDVLKGTAKSTSNEVFRDTLLQNPNAFIEIAASNLDRIVGSEPQAAVLKQAEQVIVVVGQGAENVFVNADLKAKSQETAESISKLLNGVIAWLLLAGKDQPALSMIAQTIKLSTYGDTIQVRLEIKPELIQQVISSRPDNLKIDVKLPGN